MRKYTLMRMSTNKSLYNLCYFVAVSNIDRAAKCPILSYRPARKIYKCTLDDIVNDYKSTITFYRFAAGRNYLFKALQYNRKIMNNHKIINLNDYTKVKQLW